MFPDDTNLFYAEENVKTLFDTANIELQKISQWFISNKLSHFFINPTRKIIFPLPKLSQPAITCPKLTTEALEHGVKYVQS